MITLTRRYRFPASHRLHSPALSPAENQRVFGKCNNPFGHGHDYLLEITVSGPVSHATGLLISLSTLDRLVSSEVLRLFSHRNINADIPQFRSLIPTTENIALVITDILEQHWRSYFAPVETAHLRRVQIQETDRNGFEVLLPSPSLASHRLTQKETVHA